jgi:hypothetical protein
MQGGKPPTLYNVGSPTKTYPKTLNPLKFTLKP